jgi:hypothetical protein
MTLSNTIRQHTFTARSLHRPKPLFAIFVLALHPSIALSMNSQLLSGTYPSLTVGVSPNNSSYLRAQPPPRSSVSVTPDEGEQAADAMLDAGLGSWDSVHPLLFVQSLMREKISSAEILI